ncbi:MAG: protein kinase [Planctomycetota bacterium]
MTLQRIAHFELIEPLAGGSSAGVWKARDTLLERTVAMRLLAPPHASTILREQGTRPNPTPPILVHPGILTTLASGWDGDEVYAVYDHLPSGTLQDVFAKRSKSTLECLELCIRVADALDYAHVHGFVHHDLTTSSIFLDAFGSPRMMDVDFVDASGGRRHNSEWQEVIPPGGESEMAAQHRDIRALAGILLELLVGGAPPTADQRNASLSSSRGDSRSRVSPVVSAILATCREANKPGSAYTSAEDFAKELRRHWDDEKHLLATPTIRTRLQNWLERPERISEAGILNIFIGIVISLWNGVGLASITLQSIGFGSDSFGERSTEIAIRLAAITLLVLIPSLVIGMGTIARRAWGIPAGLFGSTLGILWAAGVACGAIDFTLAGFYDDPQFRQVIFSLVAMFPLTTFIAYCVAYHAQRSHRG